MVITSKDNPKIKQLAKLYSNRRYRRETGLFVIEGIRGCVDAVLDDVEHGGLIKVEAVYYVEGTFDNEFEWFPEKLEKLGGNRIFTMTREIAGRISDTDSCQGIFVTAKCMDKPFSEEALKAGGRYLILDELQDPGNLGTMIRTSDAMGLDGIVLSGNCVDLYNPKTVRSAVGSMPRVDIFVEKDFAKVTDTFALKGIPTAAAVIGGGTDVLEYDFTDGCAVVIGNEGRGLTKEHADMCSSKVTISMHGHIDSLNAATAATILLWEMTRRGD
ncbi:RNA methyltransferase [Ruminococcus sp.]|uniref:TrmH family RNA methyltransferase n=1 Tax=Ruminococcus sp. TaxID=41978 RepID=UPI0025FD07BF|nr:RNA methyltransferase [Ruminococcus sp.]MBQ8965118.1 RNA methyltransferase [Ruminococcus sp.]